MRGGQTVKQKQSVNWKHMQKKQRQDGRESAFITNKGQFVSQTEDKKFITTSRVKKKIMKPSISLHVRAAICNILDPGHWEQWHKEQNTSSTIKISEWRQTSFSKYLLLCSPAVVTLAHKVKLIFHRHAGARGLLWIFKWRLKVALNNCTLHKTGCWSKAVDKPQKPLKWLKSFFFIIFFYHDTVYRNQLPEPPPCQEGCNAIIAILWRMLWF